MPRTIAIIMEAALCVCALWALLFLSVLFHEAGHAIVGHFLPLCDDVHMITVVPRGQAAGMTLSLPEKETDHQSKQKLLDILKKILRQYKVYSMREK